MANACIPSRPRSPAKLLLWLLSALVSFPPLVSAAPSAETSGFAEPPADNLLLFRNGDRVEGELLHVRGGVVTFSAFDSSEIRAELGELLDVRTERGHEVGLEDGTLVVGSFRRNGDPESLRVRTDLGEFDLELSRITSVEDVGHHAAVLAAKEEAAKIHLQKVWKGFFDLGFSESTGNTELRDLKATIEATRKTEVDKFRIQLFTHSATAEERKTAQKTSGEARFELFLSNDFFTFFQGRLETDELRALDLRTTLGAGLGKTWRGRHGFEVDLGLGYSFVREAFADGTDNSEGTLLLTLDLERDLGPRISFLERLVAYPRLSEGEFRLTSTTTFKTKLTDKLSLTLVLLQKVDTNPPAGIDDSDFTVTMGLRRDF